MTSEEIIAESRVPNTKSIFVLGCLESRVTVYAQQVRAINLVDAIVQKGLVRSNGSIAVVGAGAAGITAAAALALAKPDLRTIDIYEQRDDLLHLQLKSPDRYLHPHIYDWPDDGSLSTEAGLPILNWRAGTAGEVAAQILESFEAVQLHTRNITTKLAHRVERLQSAPVEGCRVLVTGNPRGGGFYDIVILSVGFGYERLITEQNRSYWDPHQLSGPIRKDEPVHHILVSGNGDGGLVDFITAAFQGVSHREVFEFITRYPGIEAAAAALQQVEERAWSADEGAIDIYEEYNQHVLKVLPDNLLLDVAEKLRPSVTVLFHTRDEFLFRRNTAVLNRFVAFLAILADKNRLRDDVTVVRKAEFACDPMDASVRFDSGDQLEPSFRFLPFGADTAKNLSPFADHVDALRSIRGSLPPGYRPATPPLTESAKKRFGSFSQKYGVVSGQQVTVHAGSELKHVQVFLRGLHGESCEWISDVPPNEVYRFWRDHAPLLVLTCDVPVSTAGPLRTVVARLAAHVARYELYCPDPTSWTEHLLRYVDRALPGPSVEIKFSVHRRPLGNVPQAGHCLALDRSTLAAQVHSTLDVEVIDQLNSELHAVLSSPPRRHFGWNLEPTLRAQVLTTWGSWCARLKATPEERRRFLVLLSSLKDVPHHSEDSLVCIGPKIIRQHLVRSTVLALAFAVAFDDTLSPVGNFPGNLKATSMTAHASGVSWMDGRVLGPEVVSHPWTTAFVLLSELQAPTALIRAGLPRLDYRADATPRIGDIPVNEQPIIVGGDYELLQALSRGSGAVRAYVTTIIRDRAAAGVDLLER